MQRQDRLKTEGGCQATVPVAGTLYAQGNGLFLPVSSLPVKEGLPPMRSVPTASAAPWGLLYPTGVGGRVPTHGHRASGARVPPHTSAWVWATPCHPFSGKLETDTRHTHTAGRFGGDTSAFQNYVRKVRLETLISNESMRRAWPCGCEMFGSPAWLDSWCLG